MRTEILSSLFQLLFVIIFFVLLVVLAAVGTRRARPEFRPIPAFTRLRKAVGLAVEAGARLHISIGRGSITGAEGAAGLAGLTILERVARAASVSDRPPVATTGEGNLALLSRDVMQTAYRAANAETQYDPTAGRMTGVTPFSYAAGAMAVAHDEQVSANIMVGRFGSEAALLTEASEQSNSISIGGSDDLAGQAVLYGAAQDPLLGEEIFAGGAYLGSGPAHEASLQVQDIFRWILIVVILLGAIARLVGLQQ